MLELVPGDEPETIGDTRFLWSELRWAARREQVVHLDDLLLRRTRLGLLLPGGGADLLPRIRETLRDDLDWDQERWETETSAYERLWNESYSPGLIDDGVEAG